MYMENFAIEIEPEYYKNGVINTPSDITIYLNGQEITNPTHAQLIEDGWVYYDPFIHDLNTVKNAKINELIAYDKSLEINSFIIGHIQAWIDRDTRVSLMNSTTILKNVGQETTTLWLNNIPYTINCELMLQMLGALEIYALQCYNVTELHKAMINSLRTVEEVLSYDYTLNYPEKLVFNL